MDDADLDAFPPPLHRYAGGIVSGSTIYRQNSVIIA
jgi:hypothetical protein